MAGSRALTNDFIPLVLSMYSYTNPGIRSHLDQYISFEGDIHEFTADSAFLSKPIHHCIVAETGNYNVLSFRGTYIPMISESQSEDESKEEQDIADMDWFNNLSVGTKDFPFKGIDIDAGKVHIGFSSAVESLWKSTDGDTEKTPVERIKKLMENGKQLLVTGYSKGAALVPIAAMMLCKQEGISQDDMIIRMFESPRVGNAAFKECFDSLFPHAFRYEYQDDFVPHIPCMSSDLTFMRGIVYKILSNIKVDNIDELKKTINDKLNTSAEGNYKSVGALRWINHEGKIEVIDEEAELKNNEARLVMIKNLVDSGNFLKLLHDHDTPGHIWDVMCDTPWPIATLYFKLQPPTAAAFLEINKQLRQNS